MAVEWIDAHSPRQDGKQQAFRDSLDKDKSLSEVEGGTGDIEHPADFPLLMILQSDMDERIAADGPLLRIEKGE